jgi:cyclohexyl-isocyanide hydratase
MIDRRSFGKQVGAAIAASILSERSFAQNTSGMPAATGSAASTQTTPAAPAGPPLEIGMLLYPGMLPIDFVGPHAFLSGVMNANVRLLWKTVGPVAAVGKLSLVATTTLDDCPKNLDVLFVPGGSPGTIALMQDDVVLDFLADRGSRARYVTSVCTGSLVLGAAGLLKGYRATSHWDKLEILPLLGATPVQERIVEDRNRITGAGATSGLDFGLFLVSKLKSQQYAELQQLLNEYDPHPPFHAGTPKEAGPELTADIRKMLAASHEGARKAALGAQERLGLAKG